MARKLPNGNYLVPHLLAFKVKEYTPEGKVVINDRIADNMLQQLLTRTDQYSVVATLNLNGDYMSDAAAAQVGGLGMAQRGLGLHHDGLFLGALAVGVVELGGMVEEIGACPLGIARDQKAAPRGVVPVFDILLAVARRVPSGMASVERRISLSSNRYSRFMRSRRSCS